MDRAFSAEAPGLEPRERAFVHELTYGVSRLQGRLDHLIGLRVHRGLDSLSPDALEILRLGAYQLLRMDGVPDYAAISESVDAARAVGGKGTAGLVNAVLRRVAEAGEGPALFPVLEADPAGYLTTWGSHPRWLVERWLERWPADEVAVLVESDNRRPWTHLAPIGSSVGEALDRLADAGIPAVPVANGAECVRLEAGASPADALEVVPGSIVQDPGAHLVTRYADVPSGMKVADLCAAPGGKALAISHRASFLLAADRSEARIQMVRENAQRIGARVACVVADGRYPPVSRIDAVLLDVPCTGTGTLARHPDARWRLRSASVMELAAVQGELLEAAAPIVAPGGLLVYSTCTLEPEENQDRVRDFLNRHPDFTLEPTDAVDAGLLDAEGHLVVTPQATGFDGAFAARLRRAA